MLGYIPAFVAFRDSDSEPMASSYCLDNYELKQQPNPFSIFICVYPFPKEMVDCNLRAYMEIPLCEIERYQNHFSTNRTMALISCTTNITRPKEPTLIAYTFVCTMNSALRPRVQACITHACMHLSSLPHKYKHTHTYP